jgi:hypothetical protein
VLRMLAFTQPRLEADISSNENSVVQKQKVDPSTGLYRQEFNYGEQPQPLRDTH